MRIVTPVLVSLCVGTVASASVLSDWNLIARHNVQSSSEVDGSALIGGNLSGASNYAVQGVTAPGNVGLMVGGTISNGPISVNNGGDLRFGGSVLTTVNLNGGNQAADATIGARVTSAFNEVGAISSYLAGLAANGTLDGAGNMNANPTLIGGERVAVYNLTPANWAGLGQMNLNFGSADSVIINVLSGGSISFVAPPNLIGGFNQANSSRILWNMPSAATVSVNNTFNGALIAPGADLQVIGGAINGSVVVDRISGQNAEIRRSNYSGFVPAPGAAGVLVMAVVLAGRRRR